MSHSNFRSLMALALDGPLPPAERAALDGHLESCSACRAVWDALLEVEALLEDAPLAAPPAGFAARTAARLHERHSRPRAVGGGLVLALAAAAMLGLIAVPLAGMLAALLRQPDALAALARAAAALFNVFGAVGGGLWLALTTLLDLSAALPLAGGLALATVPLAWFWFFCFQRLSPKAAPAR